MGDAFSKQDISSHKCQDSSHSLSTKVHQRPSRTEGREERVGGGFEGSAHKYKRSEAKYGEGGETVNLSSPASEYTHPSGREKVVSVLIRT